MSFLAAAARFAANPAARISAIEDCFENIRNRFIMAHRTGDKAQVARLDKWLDRTEEKIRTLLAELEPLIGRTRAPARPDVDIARSLATAIEALAKATGGGMWRMDTLHSLVVLHATEADRAYWYAVPEQRVSGMLRQPALVESLKSRGVLVWHHEPDGRTRIVDTNWLTAHADIRAFVLGDPVRGRRCRFCRIEEDPRCVDLVAADPEQRHGLTVDGISAAVELKVGLVYVHQRCLHYWAQWTAIARKYPTAESAAEADLAAGRVPREVPEPPTYKPDPPPEVPPGYTVSDSYNREMHGYEGGR